VGTRFEGKNLTIQGQVLVTQIQVEINLLEPAQELDRGKKCFARSKIGIVKKYF